MTDVHRPECAGFYELGDRQCDGHADSNERACKYRDRCKLLIDLGGGIRKMGERDKENNALVVSLFSDEDLDEHIEKKKARDARPAHKPAHRPPRRVRRAISKRDAAHTAYMDARNVLPGDPNPTPRSYSKRGGRPTQIEQAVRVGRPTKIKFQRPRPPAYRYTLPIADAIADLFAVLLEARRVPESDAHAQVGDVYIHYTNTERGRRLVLLRCIKEHKTKNHRVCSIWLRRSDPWVDLTINTTRERLLDVMNLRPPRGLTILTPDKIRYGEAVRVEGVMPELVPETVAWLVRVYLSGLIPMSRVTVKK